MMIFLLGILTCFLYLFFSYYNLLMLLLAFEVFMLFIYFFMCLHVSYGSFSLVLVLLLTFFMVMEVVMGLSLLVSSYRFFGVNFFNQ